MNIMHSGVKIRHLRNNVTVAAKVIASNLILEEKKDQPKRATCANILGLVIYLYTM